MNGTLGNLASDLSQQVKDVTESVVYGPCGAREAQLKKLITILTDYPDLAPVALEQAKPAANGTKSFPREAAQRTVGEIAGIWPDRADATVMKILTETAVHDVDSDVRDTALNRIRKTLNIDSSLVFAALPVLESVLTDEKYKYEELKNVRCAALEALKVIVEECPVDPKLVKATLRIAETAADDPDFMARALVQETLGIMVEHWPDTNMAKDALRLAKTAIGDKKPFVREAAQETIKKIIENCPRLADANLVTVVTKIATNDDDADTRYAAQQTLSTIMKNRPDLATTEVVKSLRKTITRDDERSETRTIAQGTFSMLEESHPALVASVVPVRSDIKREGPSFPSAQPRS